MAFLTLSTSQLFHSYNCASDKTIFTKDTLKNKFLNISFVIGIVLQLVVIYIDKVNTLFKLKPLPPNLLLISISLAFLVLIISEIKKKIDTKIEKNI